MTQLNHVKFISFIRNKLLPILWRGPFWFNYSTLQAWHCHHQINMVIWLHQNRYGNCSNLSKIVTVVNKLLIPIFLLVIKLRWAKNSNLCRNILLWLESVTLLSHDLWPICICLLIYKWFTVSPSLCNFWHESFRSFEFHFLYYLNKLWF